jgi:hypothetical protein
MTVTEQAPSTRPYAPPRLPGSQADSGEEELVSRTAGLVPLLARGNQPPGHDTERSQLMRLNANEYPSGPWPQPGHLTVRWLTG